MNSSVLSIEMIENKMDTLKKSISDLGLGNPQTPIEVADIIMLYYPKIVTKSDLSNPVQEAYKNLINTKNS